MEKTNLSPEQLTVFEAFQRAWATGQNIQITLQGPGFEPTTVQATPKILESLKTSLGASVLGRTEAITQLGRFNKAEAARIVGVDASELQGMVSEFAKPVESHPGDWFVSDDLIPVIAHRAGQAYGGKHQGA